jgi:hypothetical protein
MRLSLFSPPPATLSVLLIIRNALTRLISEINFPVET